MTDDGVRTRVDRQLARIEDAIAELRKAAPLNETERARIATVGHLLREMAPEESAR